MLFSDLPPVDENASIDLSFLSTRSDTSADSEPPGDVSAGGSFMTADAGGTQDADFMTKLEYIIVEGQQSGPATPTSNRASTERVSSLHKSLLSWRMCSKGITNEGDESDYMLENAIYTE
jgi:hypothetical protein